MRFVADNPNDVAARFVSQHPDWEIILDNDGDVIFIASPFYQFTRTEEGEPIEGSDERSEGDTQG